MSPKPWWVLRPRVVLIAAATQALIPCPPVRRRFSKLLSLVPFLLQDEYMQLVLAAIEASQRGQADALSSAAEVRSGLLFCPPTSFCRARHLFRTATAHLPCAPSRPAQSLQAAMAAAFNYYDQSSSRPGKIAAAARCLISAACAANAPRQLGDHFVRLFFEVALMRDDAEFARFALDLPGGSAPALTDADVFTAARSSAAECMRLLVARGADPARAVETEGNGDTPLLAAFGFGGSETCAALAEYLIGLGVPVNGANDCGVTPLMSACWALRPGSSPHCVAVLLRHGADVHARDVHGESALLHAANATEPGPGAAGADRLLSSAQNIALLLDHGAPSAGAASEEGVTPAHLLARRWADPATGVFGANDGPALPVLDALIGRLVIAAAPASHRATAARAVLRFRSAGGHCSRRRGGAFVFRRRRRRVGGVGRRGGCCLRRCWAAEASRSDPSPPPGRDAPPLAVGVGARDCDCPGRGAAAAWPCATAAEAETHRRSRCCCGRWCCGGGE